MKKHLVLLFFTYCIVQGCDNDKFEYYSYKSSILVLPNDPTSTESIILLEEICNYETLDLIVINGNVIEYTRNTNSLIRSPCSQVTDTTSIGRLDKGKYYINYRYIDQNDSGGKIWIGLDTITFIVN